MFELVDVKVITNENGTRTGIRLDLAGEWWQYQFRSKSFIRNRKGTPQYTRYGSLIEGTPPKIDRYDSIEDLQKRLGHCKELIDNLHNGMLVALFYENLRKIVGKQAMRKCG